MELRAFAERILFGTTLEEKLAAPDTTITDERPGPAMVAPAAPGRPAELHFKAAGLERKVEFPGARQLEHEPERGRLLHFFANHELLATELMALVLLRFPDAPAAFRRGVLRTMQDEQEHTRLYLARMRACGVNFGDLPVSGYFWRCIAGMENPLDYVAGLSLTFEQANLDFARHFAHGFAAVGDADSARLLDRIYHDEIAHVAYGLKWFRRWKNPTESDWEAFCRQLKFPLSPQRAKGLTLNIAGRRAAGFDPGFIDELAVFARSRGRTPTVFLFNPLAEGVMARGRSFTPAPAQRQLAADLASLPLFFARQDDVVITPRRPTREFLREVQHAGFALPEFVTEARELVGRKLGRLRPWAWAPDSVEQLAPLFPALTEEMRPAPACFTPAIARLYAKSWSADLLRSFLPDFPAPWLCTLDDVGVASRSFAETLSAVATIRARGHHRIVIKEALGLAGQNALRLWEPTILPAQLRWLERAHAAGSELVIEPWQERVADFSLQGEMSERGLRLLGYTGLSNDAAGRFLGNWAEPGFTRRPPASVITALGGPREAAGRVQELFAVLCPRLGAELTRAGHVGAVGIDAFVYRDAAGHPRLKPVVEINPRFTMGRLVIELMTQVAPGHRGELRLLNRAAARAAGAEDFKALARAWQTLYPLHHVGVPRAKICRGVVFLNDPAEAQVCLAVFRVEPNRPVTDPEPGQSGDGQ